MPNAQIKLVIVDDEPWTRMLMSDIFTQVGYSVRTPENGGLNLPLGASDLHEP
jgi:response regulator RpfG family c-di-GMP phosphodiesterase